MKHIYTTTVTLIDKNKGRLTGPDQLSIEISAPPEFQGDPGNWTPENLFVASVEGCHLTTLLHFIRKKKLSLVSYESRAEGVLEKTEKGLVFTSISVETWLKLENASNAAKTVEDLAQLVEKYCLVSNSIQCPVHFKLGIKEET